MYAELHGPKTSVIQFIKIRTFQVDYRLWTCWKADFDVNEKVKLVLT